MADSTLRDVLARLEMVVAGDAGRRLVAWAQRPQPPVQHCCTTTGRS